MKKFYKVAGISLGICFAIGLVFAVIGAAMGAKGVIALTKEHGIQIIDDVETWNYKDMDMTAFDSICIDSKTADVNIVTSKDGKYGVDISLMGDESTIEFVNENGTLTIKDTGSNLGFTISMIPWNTSSDNVITVYVPETADFKNISVTCAAGDIDVNSIYQANTLSIVADAGDVDVNNGTFENINIDVNAGDVTLDDVSVTASVKADMDVGDFDLNGRIEGDISVEVNVGDIDIVTGIAGSNFKYDASMNLGDIEIFGKEVEGFEGELTGNANGQYTMHLKTNVGDITVE